MCGNTECHHRRTANPAPHRGLWFLPLAGAVTLWATLEHQPDPTTGFGEWA
jgi:hypothetical protein